MASIRCAHCTNTHASVAEVRACAVAFVPALAAVGASRGAVAQAAVEVGRQERVADDTPVLTDKITNGAWAHVNDLRAQVKGHLMREERGKKIGYFALLTQEGPHDVVKFYRLRTGNAKGKWRHHLFVDAQASDDFYPVKAKDSLTAVLEGILADPEAAGLLYATELGRCSRCRRTLTDETSRARGMGPECFEK